MSVGFGFEVKNCEEGVEAWFQQNFYILNIVFWSMHGSVKMPENASV